MPFYYPRKTQDSKSSIMEKSKDSSSERDNYTEFFKYQDEFNALIKELENFLWSIDNTSICTNLSAEKKKLLEAGNKFFIIHQNKNALKQSFNEFKNACDDFSKNSKEIFSSNKVAPKFFDTIGLFAMRFAGLILAITVTLATAGITTYEVYSDPLLRRQYVNTFFKSKSEVFQNKESTWEAHTKKLVSPSRNDSKALINKISRIIN